MSGLVLKVCGVPFNLTPHPISEPPTERWQHVSYVQLEGSNSLSVALWKQGEWRDGKGKPFAKAPVQWFSLEPRK